METWYIYTVEYYADVKKNEIMKSSSEWIEVETIIRHGVALIKKYECQIFSLIYGGQL